jgi:hypothetical protein
MATYSAFPYFWSVVDKLRGGDIDKGGARDGRKAKYGGVPLSLIVSGANTHDSKKIGELLDARVVRPADEATIENLCLDAG